MPPTPHMHAMQAYGRKANLLLSIQSNTGDPGALLRRVVSLARGLLQSEGTKGMLHMALARLLGTKAVSCQLNDLPKNPHH